MKIIQRAEDYFSSSRTEKSFDDSDAERNKTSGLGSIT
jgi:hypothetical protein